MSDQAVAGGNGPQPPMTPAGGAPEQTPENINALAKNLPWVQKLMASEAELAELKRTQAEASERAEREKAEAEGNYKRALELEQQKVARVQAEADARVRQLELETAFTRGGLVDSRAYVVFASQYDAKTETIDAYVARVKADPANAFYFTPQTRPPAPSPPPANGGGLPSVTPENLREWAKSPDPKKREAAVAYRAAYFDQHGRLP